MAEAWAFARERMNPRRAGLPGLRKAERAIGCATAPGVWRVVCVGEGGRGGGGEQVAGSLVTSAAASVPCAILIPLQLLCVTAQFCPFEVGARWSPSWG